MSGETTTIPGKIYDVSSGETNDLAKLNLLGKPSIQVNADSIDTRELIDGAVTTDKLAAGVLAQINAEAIIGDGSITAGKLANGSVTYVKLNQDVLDRVVRRDTVLTTVGAYLRYSSTDGVTEEVALASLPGAFVPLNTAAHKSGTAKVTSYTTLSLPSVPAGKTAIQLRCYVANTAGANSHSMSIQDSDANSILVAKNDAGGSGVVGNCTSAIVLIYVGGGTTVSYKVEQTVGSADTGLAWQVDLLGWI